ncbi:type II secretion system secretin GspD [Henriciella sp.]|uniref:type II secretion system secretin GspD n=1 Tax=Henriciella sp. TaxID=1968823 RepID=UPI00262B23D5|nr:type II secretion system secretin GspD [Henriciella sp.]
MALALTGCSTTTNQIAPDRETAYPIEIRNAQDLAEQGLSDGYGQSLETGDRRSEPLQFEQVGRGTFTGSPALNGNSAVASGDITLNLVNVNAANAVQQVLGQILEVNYVIEANLTGSVTIQTARPVNEATVVRLLSSALSSQGATLIAEEGFYRVVSTGRAAASVNDANGNVRVIPLSFVSAESMAKMFSGMSNSGVTVETDADRNLLILRGDARSLSGMVDMVNMFDVNWMNGMSFSATPVQYTSASQIVDDLDKIFSTEAGGALAGVVRFVPIERLNVVLTVSPQPEYLNDAKAWIDRLDRSGGQASQRFYVIPIQNRAATEVANILRDTLAGDVSVGQAADASLDLRPGEVPMYEATEGEGAEALSSAPASSKPSINQIRLFADDSNNALVVLATPEQFGLIEGAVSRLDMTPNQVVLEATIAEVTLGDDLSYGLTWFFQSGEFDLSFSDVSSGAVAQQFPGFSVLFSGEDGRAALSAVAGVTDVKILSAPSLMVLDNRTATLQVGDQVPIVTQSAVSVTDPDAPIVNSVSLRDTGIILNVTPRVNDGGLVILDIDQEVSDVVATQSSGIDSPTIQQRRISTSVAVNDGESIALGGLIRERISDTKTKFPLLGDIPVLGAAFSTTNQSTTRTELLVLITPKVIRSRSDAILVTDDLRSRMKSIEDTFFQRAPVTPAPIEPAAPIARNETEAPVATARFDEMTVPVSPYATIEQHEPALPVVTARFDANGLPLAHFVPVGSFDRKRSES